MATAGEESSYRLRALLEKENRVAKEVADYMIETVGLESTSDLANHLEQSCHVSSAHHCAANTHYKNSSKLMPQMRPTVG